MQHITQEVRQFVVDNLLFGDQDAGFSNSDSFIESGLIDSMGVLVLVEFVRDKYGIAVEDEELVPDNWDSVLRITGFIEAKLTASGPSADAARQPERIAG